MMDQTDSTLRLSAAGTQPEGEGEISEANQRETALITGASAGIGAAFARELACRGYNLILTARRVVRLEDLAQQLRSDYGISVEVLGGDLAVRSDLERLENRIHEENSLGLLINNAGFGISGSYLEQPVERHQRMIDVHITATVRLSHAALPGMVKRGRGYIVNVSSIAAFIPVAGGPGYSASKAYLNVFSTNLQSLLLDKGVKVQALCPGYTYTEFHSSKDYQGNERDVLPRWVWMTAEEVVRFSLRKLDSGRVIVVPGFKNRLTAFLLRTCAGEFLMSFRRRWFDRK